MLVNKMNLESGKLKQNEKHFQMKTAMKNNVIWFQISLIMTYTEFIFHVTRSLLKKFLAKKSIEQTIRRSSKQTSMDVTKNVEATSLFPEKCYFCKKIRVQHKSK